MKVKNLVLLAAVLGLSMTAFGQKVGGVTGCPGGQAYDLTRQGVPLSQCTANGGTVMGSLCCATYVGGGELPPPGPGPIELAQSKMPTDYMGGIIVKPIRTAQGKMELQVTPISPKFPRAGQYAQGKIVPPAPGKCGESCAWGTDSYCLCMEQSGCPIPAWCTGTGGEPTLPPGVER